MRLKELIRKKRDGAFLTSSEIFALVKGLSNGELKDYQASSWLMAVFLNGMSTEEMAFLTEAMWRSGVTLERDRSDKDYWIDKHSTGGVGDKTSLILVPLVSVVSEKLLGHGKVKIPMVSGRGLGHTGGTLDKLETVNGFRTSLPIPEALRLLRTNGYFMMGQTEEMAPADRILYALRDATSTVESLPLIVSSIMSKKLSENLDGLVFDVKMGNGAFLKKDSESKKLARTLVSVATQMKVDSVAVLTSMDEPLGRKAGHRLEIEECLDFVEGRSLDKGLFEVVLELASWMIYLSSRKSVSLKVAKKECELMIGRPELAARFKEMFECQGGSWDQFLFPRTDGTKCRAFAVKAPMDGFLSFVDTKQTGFFIAALGGGRVSKESKIDPDVGIEFVKKVGDPVELGTSVATVYHRDADKALLEGFQRDVFKYSKKKVNATRWIVDVIYDQSFAKVKRK